MLYINLARDLLFPTSWFQREAKLFGFETLRHGLRAEKRNLEWLVFMAMWKTDYSYFFFVLKMQFNERLGGFGNFDARKKQVFIFSCCILILLLGIGR